jgi:hypothetical protein
LTRFECFQIELIDQAHAPGSQGNNNKCCDQQQAQGQRFIRWHEVSGLTMIGCRSWVGFSVPISHLRRAIGDAGVSQ